MPFRKLLPQQAWAQQPAIDWGHPINQGIRLFYPLSETGGLVARGLVTNANAGALTNYTTRTTSAGPRQTGTALTFNGSNQYVGGPTSVPMGTSVVTMSLWLYFVTQGGFATLLGKNAGDNNSAAWDWGMLMSPGGGGNAIYLIRNGANNSAAGALSTNVWTHVVGVVSDAESILYFNGQPVSTQGAVGAGTTANNSRQVTMMGAAGGTYVTGNMSNLRVWNRKLTPAEIWLLYAQPLVGTLAPRRRIISQVAVVSTRRPLIQLI